MQLMYYGPASGARQSEERQRFGGPLFRYESTRPPYPVAIRQGAREAGFANGTIDIFETLMDSKSLFLTPNTETVYAMTWLDLKNGPVVVESPPNVLGIVDNFWFDYVTDLGNAGPDKGQGGKFLFLPPDYL